jgi:hypothetical protein
MRKTPPAACSAGRLQPIGADVEEERDPAPSFAAITWRLYAAPS